MQTLIIHLTNIGVGVRISGIRRPENMIDAQLKILFAFYPVDQQTSFLIESGRVRLLGRKAEPEICFLQLPVNILTENQRPKAGELPCFISLDFFRFADKVFAYPVLGFGVLLNYCAIAKGFLASLNGSALNFSWNCDFRINTTMGESQNFYCLSQRYPCATLELGAIEPALIGVSSFVAIAPEIVESSLCFALRMNAAEHLAKESAEVTAW